MSIGLQASIVQKCLAVKTCVYLTKERKEVGSSTKADRKVREAGSRLPTREQLMALAESHLRSFISARAEYCLLAFSHRFAWIRRRCAEDKHSDERKVHSKEQAAAQPHCAVHGPSKKLEPIGGCEPQTLEQG